MFIENEILFYYKFKIALKNIEFQIDLIRRNVIKHMNLIVFNQIPTL
jgi:hypothetical protein